MVVVKKQRGESDDRLITRFKKEVLSSGLLQEARDRQRHKSDSEKRKERKQRLKFLDELKRRKTE